MVDVAIVGAGPAGLSAAINVQIRGRRALVLGNPVQRNPLCRAPVVDNYPGLPGIGGPELLRALEGHARDSGAQFKWCRVLSVVPTQGRFFLNTGGDVEEAGAVILATGAQRGETLPGEERLLGRGVSWCATCDGMLYRGKAVAVIGLGQDAPAEADFLQELGCQVTYISPAAPAGLREDIPVVVGRQISIEGEQSVSAVVVDGTALPCQGAFVLRETMAPGDLVAGLTLTGGYVAVDRTMATSLPGVFACGDCTGAPLQAAKAVGEGLIAGQQAAAYLARTQGGS